MEPANYSMQPLVPKSGILLILILPALLAQSTTAASGRQRVNANLDALYRRQRELTLRIEWAVNGRVRALEVP